MATYLKQLSSRLGSSEARLVVVRYSNAGLGVLSNALLASRLGPAQYGFLMTLMATQAAAVLAANWGTDSLIVRSTSTESSADAQSTIGLASTLRGWLTPLLAAPLMILVCIARGDVTGEEVVAAVLVWLSSFGAFTTVALPIAQGLDRRRVVMWTSQISGVAWSFLAIIVAIAKPTLTAGAFGILGSGVITAVVFAWACRSMNFQLSGRPGLAAIRSSTSLIKRSTSQASATIFLAIPWRLAPAAISWAVPRAVAGEIIAGVKFWEQIAIPAYSIGIYSLRKIVIGPGHQLAQSLSLIIWVTVLTIPFAALTGVVYATIFLGSGYESLQIGIIGGAGAAIVALMSQTYAPLALVAGQSRSARRVGLGMILSLACATITLRLADDIASPLSVYSMIVGVGALACILSQRSSRTTNLIIAALAGVFMISSFSALAMVLAT